MCGVNRELGLLDISSSSLCRREQLPTLNTRLLTHTTHFLLVTVAPHNPVSVTSPTRLHVWGRCWGSSTSWHLSSVGVTRKFATAPGRQSFLECWHLIQTGVCTQLYCDMSVSQAMTVGKDCVEPLNPVALCVLT